MITNIYPSGNCWHVARRPHDHCAIAFGLPQDDRPMSVRFYGPCKSIVRWPYEHLTTIARVYNHFGSKNDKSKIVHCPYDHREVPVPGSYAVTAICLRATGLQICHCAELNKIVEATMPINPDCKVSLRRQHWNDDLDIKRASYTRLKANVNEA